MMRICANKMRAFRTLASQIGALNTVLYGIDRGCAALTAGRVRLFKYYFVAQPVIDLPRLPAGRGRKLQARLVPQGDALTVRFPRPPDVIAGRYRQGAQCLALYKDDEFAGFHWHVHRHYEEDEVRASFLLKNSSSVWDFDVHVEPAHRLGVAFLRLWDEANALLFRQGVRWSCSRISAYNPDSMKSHGRMGAAVLGQAVFISIGRWQFMFSDLKPYFHVSISSRSRPVFDVDTSSLALPSTSSNPSSWRNHAAL